MSSGKGEGEKDVCLKYLYPVFASRRHWLPKREGTHKVGRIAVGKYRI